MDQIESKPGNFVEVSFKKSSSKDGNTGYDITVRSDGSAGPEKLTEMANQAINTAVKLKIACDEKVK